MPYSYSQLSVYRRCPKQYEFQCIKKIPRPITPGESFGSSLHNALKRWGELEMRMKPKKREMAVQLSLMEESPTIIPERLDLVTLLNCWHASFIASAYPLRAQADLKLREGKEVLKQFFAWWKQTPREVIAIERAFKVEISRGNGDPIVFAGRFDRVEKTEAGLCIVDYKSSSPREQTEVDADLQLSLYALAAKRVWTEPVNELCLLFLTEEGMVERRTTRSASQLLDAEKSIRSLVERIESGDLKALPSVAKCRVCPYREICPARAV